MKFDKTYSNPGDSCSYDEEFNKKIGKLSDKTAKHLKKAVKMSLEGFGDYPITNEAFSEEALVKEIHETLEKVTRMKAKFLNNFRPKSTYHKQFDAIANAA